MATHTDNGMVDGVIARVHANRTLLLELIEALERRGTSGLSAELVERLSLTGGQPKEYLAALEGIRKEVQVIDNLSRANHG